MSAYSPKAIIPVRLERGMEIPDAIARAVYERGLRGGLVIAIGGLSYAEVGVYSRSENKYYTKVFEAGSDETLEVAPLIGNYLVTSSGHVSVHVHVNLAWRRDRVAGHLVKGVVDPFLEVFLVEVGDVVREVFIHRDV
ncbi:PPC domain-containing DNA-binding protein [Thermogladius sp. 4427co]|uniref:PPC domain-containing DNA-binding protein n=1 Tax=Thermogladius sp. 4427co TaxID=3450718 RepID=UPI003F7A852F